MVEPIQTLLPPEAVRVDGPSASKKLRAAAVEDAVELIVEAYFEKVAAPLAVDERKELTWLHVRGTPSGPFPARAPLFIAP